MALGKKLKLDKLIPLIDLSENPAVDTSNEDSGVGQLVKDELIGQSQESLVAVESTGSLLDPIVTETIKVEFVPSKRKTQKKVFVHISGALTIQDVGELKNRIPLIFDEYDHVELVLKEITGIDITAIQLFNIMRVNYHSFGKYTYINAEFTNEQKKMLATCGYSEFNTQVAASA